MSAQRIATACRAAAARMLRLALGTAIVAVGMQAVFAQGVLPGASAGGESAEQKAAAAAKPDLYGRDTPRGLATGLMGAFGAGDYERAAHYLEDLGDARRDGPALAKLLQSRLDQGGSLLPFGTLSKDATGSIDDGLPADQERIGSFKAPVGDVPLIARRVDAAGAKPYWVLSTDSLRTVAQGAATASDVPLTDALPEVLNDTNVAGAPVADWLILAAVAGLVFLGLRLVFTLLLKGIRALVGDPERSRVYKFAHAAIPPLGLYVAVIVFFISINNLQVAIVARQALVRYTGIVAWVALVWFLWRSIDMAADLWASRMARSDRRRAMSALTFARRTAKTVLVLVALVAILDTVGVDVTTGIAALGLGGLALALGAQKTIENLVGSVTVIADEPVRVGDFCKVGDVLGTVEDIGMRSTRIRTNERTVVTIPNGAFSSQQIENYSRRDRFLFAPTIGLTYDTDAALMRRVLEALRTLLDDDEHVADGARVRFVGFSAHSLDIEIFAYIQTFDYAASLEMRERVWLTIMDRIEALGVSIAFPTQTVLLKPQ